MNEICRKDHLARNVARLQRLFPKAFGFFPKTWTLPIEWNEFVLYHKSKKGNCYIAKPDHGCQGKGIFLFKDLNTIQDLKQSDLVVQNYITNPCLVDGYKFDLRVYVLITSVEPLRVFVYDDGLARFATEKYVHPNESNLSQVCMHLTNYAINKHSEQYIHDQDKGSKRTIKSVLAELEKTRNVEQGHVWGRICEVILKTVLAVQPHLSKNLKNEVWLDWLLVPNLKMKKRLFRWISKSISFFRLSLSTSS